MTTSKSMMGLGVIIITAASVLIFLQHQTQQKLQADNESLRQQIAQLNSASQGAPAANSNPPASEDFNDLLSLRGKVSALRAQTNQIAKLQQQNQQLQDSLATASQAHQQATAKADEERAFGMLQLNTTKMAVLGMIMYAADHSDAAPTNFYFPGAESYFGTGGYSTNLNRFQIVYHGSLSNISNPASAIVVKSIEYWQANGKWVRAYGFADGHAETRSVPNNDWDSWEQQHLPVMKNQ